MSLATLKRGTEQLQSQNEKTRLNGQRKKGKRLEFLPWCERHTPIRGKPFSLHGREYLDFIYRNPHPYEVFRKAAQVAISTKNLLEALYLCDKYGAKILYYLANDKDAYDFSNDRVTPAIEDSNYLTRLLDERDGGVDNVGLKHIGKGSFYLRGLVTKTKAKSVDADVLVLDELDEADQENKRFAHDRILASDLQYVRELSQPSIPDYGIDESFARTDQRYWHLKCSTCGGWTCLDLDHIKDGGRLIPKHILQIPDSMKGRFPADQKYYRACGGCQAPLDMAQGEWVAQHPDREERRGYHLSQLFRQQPMVGFADPADWIMDQILGARKTSEKLRVTISILGYAYGGDRAPIDDQVLDRAEGSYGYLDNPQERSAFLGYDQGDELHIVVGRNYQDRLQVIHCEQTTQWERIPALVKQFGVTCVVGDALPNKKTAKDVNRDCERVALDPENPSKKCKAYIQYFKGDTLHKGEEGEDDDAVNKVQLDRTESLDDTTGMVADRSILLPRMERLDAEDSRTNDDMRQHLKMLVKDLVVNEEGVKKWRYKGNVPNHFGMALNSCRVAREIAPISTSSTVVVAGDVGVV